MGRLSVHRLLKAHATSDPHPPSHREQAGRSGVRGLGRMFRSEKKELKIGPGKLNLDF
jgi:hypothetical protein